jgi:uncharacterized protein DUF1206
MSGRIAADARGAANRAARSGWVERLGRAGLIAKGVLYATIAILALQVAFPGGSGGETTGKEGAIHMLAEQPFGTAVLVVLAIGLAGYAVWRLTQAVLGTGETDERKELALRLAAGARGLIYIALCVLTVRLLTGSAGRGADGGGAEQELTARLLGLPFGVALVVLAGLVLLAVAAHEGYQGATRGFLQHLQTAQMSPGEREWVTRLGIAGLWARAVVFTLMGFFLIRAALEFDPEEAVGLDGALQTLAASGAGPWLLGIVAAGLLAYAAFCFALARYARIRRLD